MGIEPIMPDSIRTPRFLEQFRRLEPDIGVVVAYGKILSTEILSIPEFGCVNVHASLLPELRGAAPIQWAVARGFSETGVTLMQMDEGMDTGPILLQEQTPVQEGETAAELAGRLSLMAADILRRGLPALARGELAPVPQDDALATYAPRLRREDGLIDWSLPARDIDNRVRGFTPWPGTFTVFGGKRILITSSQPCEVPSPSEPGLVLKARADGILVACGNGALQILSVKPEGKREMTSSEFLAGRRLSPGDRFDK
jgi:methionyl-tRNA formyltransferase